MPTPHIFFGLQDDGALSELSALSYRDYAQAYDMIGKTNPYAPAGAGGEAVFPALYLIIKRYGAVDVYITPFVDDDVLETTKLSLPALSGSDPETTSHEIGLSIPYTISTVEHARFFPRGTWFQVRIETQYGEASERIIVESCEVEYEVMRESKPTEGTKQ